MSQPRKRSVKSFALNDFHSCRLNSLRLGLLLLCLAQSLILVEVGYDELVVLTQTRTGRDEVAADHVLPSRPRACRSFR